MAEGGGGYEESTQMSLFFFLSLYMAHTQITGENFDIRFFSLSLFLTLDYILIFKFLLVLF